MEGIIHPSQGPPDLCFETPRTLLASVRTKHLTSVVIKINSPSCSLLIMKEIFNLPICPSHYQFLTVIWSSVALVQPLLEIL